MMQKSSIPNILTVIRIILTPIVIITLLKSNFILALCIFLIAGITDGLDGFLAKKYRWQTRLGAILDPLADKFMLLSNYIVLGFLGLIPSWLVFLVLMRDVIIVAGATGYHYGVEFCELKPTKISKLNTLLQIILVLFVIFYQIFTINEIFLNISYIIVTTSTIISGVYYVWVWTLKVINKTRR
jgi:cardiolipin synthase (CMP-forming)